MQRFINYVRDTRGELVHVNWPSKKTTAMFTLIVILVSLLTAAFLGFFDYIFSLIIQKFVL